MLARIEQGLLEESVSPGWLDGAVTRRRIGRCWGWRRDLGLIDRGEFSRKSSIGARRHTAALPGAARHGTARHGATKGDKTWSFKTGKSTVAQYRQWERRI